MKSGDIMFEQNKYINNYVKDNYRTIKFRVRKDDKLITRKLESIENINRYIYSLILKDINDNRVYNYINDSIDIDFELSKPMEKLIKDAEVADYLNDYGQYMNYAYAIDTRAKNEVNKHIITEGQWNKLAKRYCL